MLGTAGTLDLAAVNTRSGTRATCCAIFSLARETGFEETRSRPRPSQYSLGMHACKYPTRYKLVGCHGKLGDKPAGCFGLMLDSRSDNTWQQTV